MPYLRARHVQRYPDQQGPLLYYGFFAGSSKVRSNSEDTKETPKGGSKADSMKRGSGESQSFPVSQDKTFGNFLVMPPQGKEPALVSCSGLKGKLRVPTVQKSTCFYKIHVDL
jgi:hypothetical protein